MLIEKLIAEQKRLDMEIIRLGQFNKRELKLIINDDLYKFIKLKIKKFF